MRTFYLVLLVPLLTLVGSCTIIINVSGDLLIDSQTHMMRQGSKTELTGLITPKPETRAPPEPVKTIVRKQTSFGCPVFVLPNFRSIPKPPLDSLSKLSKDDVVGIDKLMSQYIGQLSSALNHTHSTLTSAYNLYLEECKRLK